MDFDRNNIVTEDPKAKKKKMLLIGMGACVVLIILMAVLVMVYKNIDAKTFKLYMNDVQVSVSPDFLISDENGNAYVKAKDIASYVGWTYMNGEYGSYTEDNNSGYFQNDYEVSSFKVGSNKLKKYIQVSVAVAEETQSQEANPEETIKLEARSKNGTLETTDMDLPVISSNGQIYLPFNNINDICNCFATNQNYRMHIYEQNYLLALASNNAVSFGYTGISGVYENVRALGYGMMVVNKNDTYGVVNLFNGTQVLGFKYSDIVFNQNVKEFFVKAKETNGDETVGLISYDGKVIISPKSYDEISVLSDELGLYLVQKDDKYGVLNREGNVVVHAEYDSVGLPEGISSAFNYTADDNIYLLFDNTIIVEVDGKYGLYNLEGDEVLQASYDGIGYIANSSLSSTTTKDDKTSSSSSTDKKQTSTLASSENVLTIDCQLDLEDGTVGKTEAIVVEKLNLDGEPSYGIYDAVSEKLIIPCACTRIYAKTKAGVVTYYMEFNGEQINFEEYVKLNKLYTVDSSNKTTTDTVSETEEQ